MGCKCKHEWEYWDTWDMPNGYEYDWVKIPHRRCKKCGREYELFNGYGDYANRWRRETGVIFPEIIAEQKEHFADTSKKIEQKE